MVTKYGMSDNLGPIDFQGRDQNDYMILEKILEIK